MQEEAVKAKATLEEVAEATTPEEALAGLLQAKAVVAITRLLYSRQER